MNAQEVSSLALGPKADFLAFLKERFWATSAAKPDLGSVDRLERIAAKWRDRSQHFYAGYARREALESAWGDRDAVEACVLGAKRDFESGAKMEGADELEVAASLRMWLLEAGSRFVDADPSSVCAEVRSVQRKLAEHLVRLANLTDDAQARAGFLIRGFRIKTDFEGAWYADFPGDEVRGYSTSSDGSGSITLTVPSAFGLYISCCDYQAADSLSRTCPDGFTSPGVRGWRAAVRGCLAPDQSVELFTEAAEEFSTDTAPQDVPRSGSWTSANIDLWAKYFQARASIAEIPRRPEAAADLLSQAIRALEGTDSGWVSLQVTCFRILVTALDQILGEGDAVAAAAQARDAIIFAARHSPLDEDGQLVVGFLDAVAAAFAEIREDPPAAWVSGRLLSALDRLGRIPVLGDEVAAALTPAVGQRAEATRHAGHIHSWISPAIAAIKSETALQKLLLRLLAAQLPMYVQIRHGPLEYGKDIAVLIERNGRCVLRMYQLKVGDITRKNWPKTRDQLEEMLQVAMCSVQLPEQPHEMEGILLFNGHIHPQGLGIVA